MLTNVIKLFTITSKHFLAMKSKETKIYIQCRIKQWKEADEGKAFGRNCLILFFCSLFDAFKNCKESGTLIFGDIMEG